MANKPPQKDSQDEYVGDPIGKAGLTKKVVEGYEEKTRFWLTRVIVTAALAALVVACVCGSFSNVERVWAIEAGPLGTIIGFYYGRGKQRKTN